MKCAKMHTFAHVRTPMDFTLQYTDVCLSKNTGSWKRKKKMTTTWKKRHEIDEINWQESNFIIQDYKHTQTNDFEENWFDSDPLGENKWCTHDGCKKWHDRNIHQHIYISQNVHIKARYKMFVRERECAVFWCWQFSLHSFPFINFLSHHTILRI